MNPLLEAALARLDEEETALIREQSHGLRSSMSLVVVQGSFGIATAISATYITDRTATLVLLIITGCVIFSLLSLTVADAVTRRADQRRHRARLEDVHRRRRDLFKEAERDGKPYGPPHGRL